MAETFLQHGRLHIVELEEDVTVTSESTNVDATNDGDDAGHNEVGNSEAQNGGRGSPIYSKRKALHFMLVALLIQISYTPANLAPSRTSRFPKHVCR